MHLPVAVTQEQKIVGVYEVRNVDLRSKLNTWESLEGLTVRRIDNIEIMGECTSLPNAGAHLKRHEHTPTCHNRRYGGRAICIDGPQHFSGHPVCSHYDLLH